MSNTSLLNFPANNIEHGPEVFPDTEPVQRIGLHYLDIPPSTPDIVLPRDS